jgi:hypothetical protein
MPYRGQRLQGPESPQCFSTSSAFPTRGWVGFPRMSTDNDFSWEVLEVADIPLCSGLQVCSPPRSFLPLRVLPQGSRGFYIRAYRALLPPHAPDMLTVRTQVIDGTGTCTLSDSQPCRLLTSRLLPSLLRVPTEQRAAPLVFRVIADSQATAPHRSVWQRPLRRGWNGAGRGNAPRLRIAGDRR